MNAFTACLTCDIFVRIRVKIINQHLIVFCPVLATVNYMYIVCADTLDCEDKSTLKLDCLYKPHPPTSMLYAFRQWAFSSNAQVT